MVLRGDWRMALYRIHMGLRGVDLNSVGVGEMGLLKERSHWYADSGGPRLEEVLDKLPISACDEAIDFGCGKGGAIITMARRPFARIDGVEISPELVAAARANLRKMGLRHSAIFHSDAEDFTDLDRYSVIYIFNPFTRVVMAGVVRNIAASLARRPRSITLIYKNPVDADLFENIGFLRVSEFRNDENPTLVYTYQP
jgi:SAM-dependent methyltransferase